jgi:holo-[acyl-carrier protein] synthase
LIIGIGTDIVEIARIGRILESAQARRFLLRVLTESELAQAESHQARLAEFVAGRFAAKEAAAKALGCGIGGRTGFRDVEIVPAPSGKPECRLSAKAREAVAFRDGDRLHLSLSHSDVHAVAFAVWERP